MATVDLRKKLVIYNNNMIYKKMLKSIETSEKHMKKKKLALYSDLILTRLV